MQKQTILHGMVLLIVTVMVGAAELFQQNEIIFPEITAIAVGAFMAPKMAWKTNRISILVFVMLCAACGVGIVLFIPLPLWLKVTLAYGIGQIIYLLSGTSFAPMISAIALPVLLGTESMVYLIAAFLLTALILIVHMMLEKTKLKEPLSFAPVTPQKQDWGAAVKRFVLIGIAAWAAIRLNLRFAVAPPLLVAFTEFSKIESGARKIPVKVVSAIALCALSGAACRYFLVVCMGLPLTAAAILAAICMIVILTKLKVYVPPAGALCILPMLIPADAVLLYPLQIFAGAALFMTLSLICFRS